jgi:hypothetical protein
MSLLSFLSTVWHLAVVGLIWYGVIGSLFSHKKRKSPEAYRRERQYRQAENAATRYAAKPPLFKVIDQEKRFKKARRSAVAAVRWALVAKDFNQDEIGGAVVLAVRTDREVVFDHDRLYESCLQILRRATMEEGS